MNQDQTAGLNKPEPHWEQIVERHGKRVFRVALRILGCVEDAEDVAQEVFVEAYRLHRAGPVQTWAGLLVRLAVLRAMDQWRKRRAHGELRDNDRVSNVEPFAEVAARELADWLRMALTRLPDQQAAIFAMTHFEHMERDEVAQALGISAAGVSSALYKARQRLLMEMALLQQGERT